jgi:uncharacterized protein YprB with RNaseH-like and TPR domain
MFKFLNKKFPEWSAAEDAILQEGRALRIPYRIIADLLKRGQDACRNRWWELNKNNPTEPWYTGLRIGCLDIETSNLEANAGPMLSWAIKAHGDKAVHHGIITIKELTSGRNDPDRRIVVDLIDAMRKFDVIVTYYGTGFDIPFIRTRAMGMDLDFPAIGELYHWDLYYACKSKLKTHRKSLDAVTAFLGIPGKTHLDMEVWFRARLGDKDALDYVLDHNLWDVKILSKLLDRMLPHQKWIRKPL